MSSIMPRKILKCLQTIAALTMFVNAWPAQSEPPVPLGDTIDIAAYSGAIGDGIADDTSRVQMALTACSNQGLTCVIPANKSFLITKELYLWGAGNLVGVDSTSRLHLNTGSVPYILNVGIAGAQKLKSQWSGRIQYVTFQAVGPGTGRVIFLWRSDGGMISNNIFNVGPYGYGPTSSGNNNNIVRNGNVNCIRKNIKIIANVVTAEGTDLIGNEGIGLNQWDGAEIAHNTISGVGDDMIGIHFSSNINIHDNDLSGVDGRLFVANSRHVTIVNNKIAREASRLTGLWYPGIALLYIGHEADVTNNDSAPTSITAQGNTLMYNSGAIDRGAAIYVYGPRNVTVSNNHVINNSSATTAVGIHVLPFPFLKGSVWTDPDGLDPPMVSRVHNVTISNNNLNRGSNPMSLIETGQHCDYYVGPVTIANNRAGHYSFICNPVTRDNLRN
jgi:hypothetical protein